jgi:hypothetical protein
MVNLALRTRPSGQGLVDYSVIIALDAILAIAALVIIWTSRRHSAGEPRRKRLEARGASGTS